MGWFYCMRYQCKSTTAQKICKLCLEGDSWKAYDRCRIGTKTITYDRTDYTKLCEWFFIVQEEPVN